LLILVIGLMSACETAAEIEATVQAELDRNATATAEAVPTVTPTSTNTPTMTPTSTPTNTPTNTPTPTPIPTSVFVPDVPVLEEVNFDSANDIPSSWDTLDTTIENGIAIVEANQEWLGIFTDQKWVSGQTILVSFRYAAGSLADLYIAGGEYETPSYRSWGVINDYGYIGPFYIEGEIDRQLSWQQGYVLLMPDHWYVLMIYIGSPEQEFIVRLWDQEDPAKFMEKRQLFDDLSWANLQWYMAMTNGPVGGLEIDRFEVMQGLPDLSAWDPEQ
jgi:hypothetical protein